jgi:hypothetical protein
LGINGMAIKDPFFKGQSQATVIQESANEKAVGKRRRPIQYLFREEIACRTPVVVASSPQCICRRPEATATHPPTRANVHYPVGFQRVQEFETAAAEMSTIFARKLRTIASCLDQPAAGSSCFPALINLD